MSEVARRRRSVARAPEQIEMALLGKGGIERSLLPLHPPRHHSRKTTRGGRDAALGGIADRILHRGLQSAKDRRRGKVDGVGAPQVEARRGIRAESRLAEYVARGDEIAAAHPEKAQRVAVFLEWGIHIAQPHVAPNVTAETGKRIAVGDRSGRIPPAHVHPFLRLPRTPIPST